MAAEPTLYDLMLLLSTDAPDEQRARILSNVESSITGAGGSIERNDEWGRRPMAYEIRHRSDAEYHLLQFHAPPSLIEELTHTLHITDGVLRLRVIKVRRGTPPVKEGAPPVVAAVAGGSGFSSDGPREGSSRAPAPTAAPEESDGAPAAAVAEEPAEAAAPAAAVADVESGDTE